MSKLILLRHGQSTANAAGEFTGWTDAALTEIRQLEAHKAARLLHSADLLPDSIHTSVLWRSIHTAQIVADDLGRSWLPVHRSWRLNERHYGALTTRKKSHVRLQVGTHQYRLWRRSFEAPPPPMPPDELENLRADPRYADLPHRTIPACESLADVLTRLLPYWIDEIAAELRHGGTPLVVAHGNSLRALVMHLDQLSPAQVAGLNIPTGIPLCYDLDEMLTSKHSGGHYLDPDTAESAAEAIAAEGEAG
ncbi:2,3-bisphosphoglycerate-dependent phosphoglycerate mutase [Microlunatus endophyticus]|uniref:2,3-bisphosphoglycerate-dependent phosphoglycerate mutase n=1 Tax=Microlunatus endophyticus TaxID=1716077 RepID=A0A917SH95_9ACTN|nr:2,3-bisphosphoglycerate-dependent phosphoglycerate mutase [Microlunatus endophyticus]GGL79298.1 2,3-bisphosphoglycerate-dependent phosphoglycerate mutase [Microlunatus endophyticus]